ncbi:hypothetical protein K2Z83_20330 [Oscillochloris sp. ZM17-4]|uniref:hypothetical protein n=1 Tax=Oscillochloris sp. ZM17-4 TaxID=2866714 RepID=UPI001C73D92E|nr:hypothetical protein [Oscillochloris sp. ZM17-4]MBX0330019.1 hypothetical protein [Oscillochloris sp. ZM17-4]
MSADDTPTPIRPSTRRLLDALILDIWPPHAALVDFGIAGDDQYRALQIAVRQGETQATLRELDAMLGDGAKITAWVRRFVPDAPQFTTAWDSLPREE